MQEREKSLQSLILLSGTTAAVWVAAERIKKNYWTDRQAKLQSFTVSDGFFGQEPILQHNKLQLQHSYLLQKLHKTKH